MGDLKAVTLGDPPLEGFQCLVLEFNDLSAIEANEVIMVGPFRSRFKSRLSVGEFSLGGQTETCEEFQSAINGGVTNSWIGFGDLGVNLREALVPGRIQEDVEDLFPLSRCLQPFFRNPCPEETVFDGTSSF